ncbi:Aste57867_19045 [Aphanomyces stellatus]|uniref:1-alkyl-2-acetylglycerophosphocholine esterase n=1 Tax=Aphanomyces stellatus TaxID=120398 RepID=A0A485LDB6_9STRA|nr:hypothetical protein As57867_018981 [Aphanomyces stellatus]VFT95770.1 Aste57867_19045 [Aphanomyces stellatus]
MKRLVLVERCLLVLLLAQSVLLHAVTSQIIQGIADGVVVLAFLFHKWRVELVPAYVLFVLNAAAAAATVAPPLWLVWVQGALFLFTVTVVFLFPLPLFPTLSSAYPDVGCVTMRLHGVDCRIFYPADAPGSQAPLLPYLHHGKHLAMGLHIFIELPALFFASLRNGILNARVNAQVKAAPTEAGWPAVVFSHGMGGSLELYSSIHQYVASEGLIVVALNHSDGSAAVSRNPDDVTYSYYDRPPASALADWANEGFYYRNNQLQKRVQHVRDVVDALERLQSDSSSLLYHHINLNQVAVAGHSFGGATAISACVATIVGNDVFVTVYTRAKRDVRLKAVVGLDIWMEPLDADVVADGVAVPVCSVISHHWHKEWDSHFELLKAQSRRCDHPNSAFLAIGKTRHQNFCDMPLFSPFLNQHFKAAGPIDPTYLLHMVGQLMASFLRQQFHGDPSFDCVSTSFPELLSLKDTTYNTFL